jgi:hypothetical protein
MFTWLICFADRSLSSLEWTTFWHHLRSRSGVILQTSGQESTSLTA